MSVLLLVRHGQASFGTEDYDRLSVAGARQSRIVGAALAAAGLHPGSVVSGRMRRQQETAAAMIEGATWDREIRVDPAWDEFDVMDFLQEAEGPGMDSRAFQEVLDEGMRRWTEGHLLNETGERFTDFVARVEAGLGRLGAEPAAPGPVVVTTSAGVISWVVTSLLEGGVEQWIRLNRVCVNAGVTRVVLGRSGTSLVSFNEHGHFQPADITYR
jgi:broad specificity phosphatase PhoE